VNVFIADDRPVVMGILNVTPDSFSDGGRYESVDQALAHARTMVREGADLVDVGGESTRPGATRISIEEEQRRVLPVIRALVAEGIPVSVDTMNADTALAAADAGASFINDVSGGRADAEMFNVMAKVNLPCVLMHWRAFGDTMDQHASYQDVVAEVCSELAQVRDQALNAGVDAQNIVLDPGLGFAKEHEHNWALLRALDELKSLGHPLLIGASRKRFLGALLAQDGEPRPINERDAASDAIAAIAAFCGVWGIRTHRVAGVRDAVRVGRAWRA
jgi:dihydropteroate synthase